MSQGGSVRGPRWAREAEKPRDLRGAMSALLVYMGRERRYLYAGMACALASSVLALVGPQYLARITDSLSYSVLGGLPVDMRLIASLGLLLILIYGASFVLSVAENRLISSASERVCRHRRLSPMRISLAESSMSCKVVSPSGMSEK